MFHIELVIKVLARRAKNQYTWKGFGAIPIAIKELKEEGVRENTNDFDGNDHAKCQYTRLNNISFFFHYSIPPINRIEVYCTAYGLLPSNFLNRKIHSFWRKVFAEADAMARKNREKLPSGLPLINRDSLQPMLYPLRMRHVESKIEGKETLKQDW